MVELPFPRGFYLRRIFKGVLGFLVFLACVIIINTYSKYIPFTPIMQPVVILVCVVLFAVLTNMKRTITLTFGRLLAKDSKPLSIYRFPVIIAVTLNLLLTAVFLFLNYGSLTSQIELALAPILGVISEELACRGVLLNAFRGGTRERDYFAVAFSSVLFGLLHIAQLAANQSLTDVAAQAIAATFLGFGYAAARVAWGSIWPSVAFHWLWNNLYVLNNPYDTQRVAHPERVTQAFHSVSVKNVFILVQLIISILLLLTSAWWSVKWTYKNAYAAGDLKKVT